MKSYYKRFILNSKSFSHQVLAQHHLLVWIILSKASTQTIPTTIFDCFNVLGKTPLPSDGIKGKPSFRKTRDPRGIKAENTLKFRILFEQKHKQNYTRGIF